MSISVDVINNWIVQLFTAIFSSPWTFSYETKKTYGRRESVLAVTWLCQLLWGLAISLRYPEQKFCEQ